MKSFDGQCIVQTMFLRGKNDEGEDVTNVGEEYVAPWLEAVKYIAPREVMIYTIDRETPGQFLEKATHEGVGYRVYRLLLMRLCVESAHLFFAILLQA